MIKENGVWALVECQNGKLRDGAAELVCQSRKIANKLGEKLTALILGNIEDEPAQHLAQCGADRILSITHPALSEDDVDINSSILTSAIQEQRPNVFLASDYVTDLVTRVAARLTTGLVTFCDGADVNDEKLLLLTKSVYGNKASATFVCPGTRPQMATLNTDALEIGPRDRGRSADIIRMEAGTTAGKPRTRITGFISGDPRTIDLSEADVIVDGGRGLGSKEGFKLVEDLAEVIGGSVGASRMAIDKGWCNVNRQIGTTGKMVKPKLVIACGVSGAPQHIMGMNNTGAILAINTDRKAPIFRVADIAVVANALELLPLIIGQIRRNLKSN
jgi:electron transfer flavoprotein alpha subunit